MARIEKQLRDITHQIDVLRKDLHQSREQLIVMSDMAEDARIRAIVSETPSHDDAAHDLILAHERMEKVIISMEVEIANLRKRQDQLLDKLINDT